jgi:hypothetical protein
MSTDNKDNKEVSPSELLIQHIEAEHHIAFYKKKEAELFEERGLGWIAQFCHDVSTSNLLKENSDDVPTDI